MGSSRRGHLFGQYLLHVLSHADEGQGWVGTGSPAHSWSGRREQTVNNLFSFVIVYLCLHLATLNGVGTPARAARSHSLFMSAWRNKASADTGVQQLR